MSNLIETSTFTGTVNKIDDLEEITEALLNLAAQALTNRTRYLLDQLAGHTSAGAPHGGHETPTGAQQRVDNHAGLTAPHSATAAAVGSRLALRSPTGTCQFAAGVSGNDAIVLSQFLLNGGGAGRFIVPCPGTPSGLWFQWNQGVSTTIGDTTQYIPFPYTFPSVCAQAFVSTYGGGDVQSDAMYQDRGFTAAGVTVVAQYTGAGLMHSGVLPRVFAIGW